MTAKIASAPSVATILERLSLHVLSQPDAVAYTFLKSDDERLSITYQELDQRARSIAHGLLQQAEPGDRALMMYPAGLEFIEAFLGCLYAGIVAVPAYPPKKNRNAERILSIVNDCSPRLLLCTSETKRNVDGEFAQSVQGASVIVTDELDSAISGSLPDIRSDQLAFLQYTSGSTAAPKGVMVTHGNMVANELLIQKCFQLNEHSIVVSWLPMFHDMGLIGGILAPLFVGFPSILMLPNAFLREPIKWLRAVSEFRGTCTGAPNFAYDLCVRKVSEDQKKQLDLSSLEIAYNGAEPVKAKTLENFASAFAVCGLKQDACFPCYGMAETTLLVSGGPPLTPTGVLTIDSSLLAQHRIVENDEGQQVVSCGQVGADLEVRIINPETFAECPPDEVGEIWVFGDSVAKGYWNRPEETQQSFHAKLTGDDRNWLRTGDYGFMRACELYVTGRLKDLIIIRGRNIYPQDIEQLVERHFDFVEPNSCAAFSIDEHGEEKLVIVAEGARDMVRPARICGQHFSQFKRSFETLRTEIVEKLDVTLKEILFVRPTTFPRTSSGKLQRHNAKLQYKNSPDEGIFRINDVVLYASPSKATACSSDEKVLNRAEECINWLREFSERRLNSFVADERRTLPPHAILEMGNHGLLGMQAPRELGGLDLANRDVMRVMEQLAAIDMSLASVIGVHNGLGLRPILKYGTAELKAEVAHSLASGRQLASFALTEPGSGSNPLAMTSLAKREGSAWRLTAHKQWIGLAQWAGTINVFAHGIDDSGSAAGIVGIVVPESHPKLRHGAESLTMGLRSIIQNDVFVDGGLFESKYALGVPGDGFTVAQDAMMFCRLGIAAESIGIIKRCFQLMHRYASRRSISTGRLLDNPVTADRLEELLIAASALESLVYGIATALDSKEAVPVEAYMTCKVIAPELAWTAADMLVQCLGGRGYVETNEAPRILRDTRLLRIFEGPTETLQTHLGSRTAHQLDALKSLLISLTGKHEIADQLALTVDKLAIPHAGSASDRQWRQNQLGKVASWAVLLGYCHSRYRPAEIDQDRVESWTRSKFEAAMMHATRSMNRGTGAGASLFSRASKLIRDSVGDCNFGVPEYSLQRDTIIWPTAETNSSNAVSVGTATREENEFPHQQFGETHMRLIVRRIVLDWLQAEVSPAISSVADDRHFGSLGIDSVAAVSLTVAIEKQFGIQLPDGLLFQHQSIDELVAYLENRTSVAPEVSVRLAVTTEDKEAVYRFRYSVYIEEMKRFQKYADHENKQISDPLDEHGDVFAIWQGRKVVGTVRLNPLRRDSLPEYRRIYGIEQLSAEELVASSISTRIMLAPHIRKSTLGGKLLAAAYQHGRSLGIKYDYCDCNDPVKPFFEQLGYRALHRVNHPEYGDVTVMRLDLEDTAFLESIGSPLVI